MKIVINKTVLKLTKNIALCSCDTIHKLEFILLFKSGELKTIIEKYINNIRNTNCITE